MAKKGQTFQRYSEELKLRAILMYETGNFSYEKVAKELEIPSSSPIKAWVKKHRNNESLTDLRGKSPSSTEPNPLKGRPRTNFKTVEEEGDYLKAQVEYLKKQYANLYGEE